MNSEMVVFPFLNNWIQEVKLRYNYITAISENKRFVEQRRSLKNIVLREQDLTFTKESAEKSLLLNTLLYAKDKRIALPIYSELFFTSTSPLLGESTLVIVEDISEYWNLWNQCTHILIIQEYNVYELIEKNYATSNSIILESAVTVNFTGDDVEIYPVFFCNLKDIKPNYVNSKVYTLDLSFQEIRIYQHNESEEDAQADYFLYNYSKSNPIDVVIPEFIITKNGDITIIPPVPPPVETPIIIVTSKDSEGNVLRAEDAVLDENGEIKITNVGDEVYIQIAYKYTNAVSADVEIPDDFWVTDVTDWWSYRNVTTGYGINRLIELTNDGESLGKTIDHKEIEIYLGTTYDTLVTKILKTSFSTYVNKYVPLLWGYDAYDNDGSLPEDYYTNFMAYSSPLSSAYDKNPDEKEYPPPGSYSEDQLFVVRCKEIYTDTTSRITQKDTTEQCKFYDGGDMFAYMPSPQLWTENVDSNHFRIYVPGFTSRKQQGMIPTATYRGYCYNYYDSVYHLVGETSGTFSVKTGHWGSVVFPRALSQWGLSSPWFADTVVIQMVYCGVEVWFAPEDCSSHFIGA